MKHNYTPKGMLTSLPARRVGRLSLLLLLACCLLYPAVAQKPVAQQKAPAQKVEKQKVQAVKKVMDNSPEEFEIEETDPNAGQLNLFETFHKPQFHSVSDYLNAVIPYFIANNHGVGVAIGVIQNGRPQAFYFGETAKGLSGRRGAAGSGQRPNGSTLFMIGSITKTFTATLLALDVEKHLVQLDDPLQKYVPAGVTVPSYGGKSITLETLATHTSGLPRKSGIPTIPGLFNSLNGETLTYAPGSRYKYSNFGFAVLGQALAKVGGKSFEALLDQEVSRPLGLVDTTVEPKAGQLSRRAQGYDGQGAPVGYALASERSPAGNPAGALFSTIDDMLKFLSYNMGLTNSPLNSLRHSLFQERHPARPPGSVGLAWQMNPLSGSNDKIIWKDGGVPGFSSYTGFIPKTGMGVVVLLNFRTKQAGPLGTDILRYLVESAAPSRSKSPLP